MATGRVRAIGLGQSQPSHPLAQHALAAGQIDYRGIVGLGLCTAAKVARYRTQDEKQKAEIDRAHPGA